MLNERGTAIVTALDEVANELGARPSQVALAWLMVQPGVVAPIASATNVDQLREIMGCANLELSDAQLEHLNNSGRKTVSFKL